MALPNLTPEQRQAALAKAAAVRQARKLIKDDLKAGKMTLEHALTLPEMQRCKVYDLLKALPGIGTAKAKQLMVDLHISEKARVQGLGVNQRAALLEQFN